MSDVVVRLIDETWRANDEPWTCYGPANREYIPGRRTPGVTPTVVALTFTDEDGRFRFDGNIPSMFRLDFDLPPDWILAGSTVGEPWHSLTESGHTFHAYLETIDRHRGRMIDGRTGEPLAGVVFKLDGFQDVEYVVSDEDGWILSSEPQSGLVILSGPHVSQQVWPERIPDAGAPYLYTGFSRERVRLETSESLEGVPVRYRLDSRWQAPEEVIWHEAKVVEEGRTILLQPDLARVGCDRRVATIVIEADGGRLFGEALLPLADSAVPLVERRRIDVVVVNESGAPIPTAQIGWEERGETKWQHVDEAGRGSIWTPDASLSILAFEPSYGGSRQVVNFDSADSAQRTVVLYPDEASDLEVVIRPTRLPVEVPSGAVAATVLIEPIRPNAVTRTEQVRWEGGEARLRIPLLSRGPHNVRIVPNDRFLYDAEQKLVDVPTPSVVFVRHDDVSTCEWIVELDGLPPKEPPIDDELSYSSFFFSFEISMTDASRARTEYRRSMNSCGTRSGYPSGTNFGRGLRCDARFDFKAEFISGDCEWRIVNAKGTSERFSPPEERNGVLARVLRLQVEPK